MAHETSPLLPKSPALPSSPESSQRPPWQQHLTLLTALMNCLFAGSVLIYSLWAPLFQSRLHYSQMQVNLISAAAEIFLYLPVPIFGFICDKYGPARLSFLSAVFFGLGYALAAIVYANSRHYSAMVIAFAAVGMGTSSMYFSGVTTCAKTFTGRRGLALAAPIAAFGLSSLWMTQVVSRVFVDTKTGDLAVDEAFWFFCGALVVVGVLGTFGLRFCVVEEREEEKPGWINDDTRAFLRDRTMWWFAAGVFLMTGPGEAFINNMGTLIHTLRDSPTTSAPAVDPATHVSLIALTSTLSRLIAGSVSDYLAPVAPPLLPTPSFRQRRLVCSRMFILFAFSLLMLSGYVLVASSYVFSHPASFWLVSSSIGAGYGAVFCLAPTIVSVVWGTRNFGTNWGIVSMTPAIGAVVYGSAFAAEWDGHARPGIGCAGPSCARWSFAAMAASVLVAVAGWWWAWRGSKGWKHRGVVV